MWTLFFLITTIVCTIGWLSRYVSCAAMIYYMQKKQYKLPEDSEIEECTAYVVKRLFKLMKS